MSADALRWPVRRVAAALRDGSLTSVGLVQAQLARIDATEPVLLAYAHVARERALDEADTADRELAAGRDRGLLHGCPIAVKDLIDTAEITTTYGSSIFGEHLPERDATVVTRLREAGAVLVGKTNTHEFALGAETPPTRNPFDADRIPGGSSGGSAVAVAAGSAFLALGTDTGGSIRIPASFCGVVGLKPTYGLVSRTGVFPESWSLDHIGPITRYAEDAAAVLEVLVGYDEADTSTSRGTSVDFLSGIDRGADGVRLGLPVNYFFEHLQPDVESSVSAAIEALTRLGAVTREVTVPYVPEIIGAHAAIDLAEIAAHHRRLYLDEWDKYLPESLVWLESGLSVRATTYIDAQRARPGLITAVLDELRDVDVLVVPTQPATAPLREPFKAGVPLDFGDFEEDPTSAMVRFTAPFNYLGLPSVTVSCGYDSNGQPIGLQLIGKPFADALVLQVAQAYQSVTTWLDGLPDGRL